MFSIHSHISIKELLESGVHFGHKASRWNPQMAKYIYKTHKGVHIIDLPKTVEFLQKAMEAVYNIARDGGRILFVGTKAQAKEAIKQAAQRCGQYYINHRWLGGTLTNWQTVSQSIKKLKDLDDRIHSEEFAAYTKKEQLGFHHALNRLETSFGGIKNMGGIPDALFIIDTNKENIAVDEAQKLGIPIIAVVDTNSDPRGIDYPIPGNDDALKALQLYCDLISKAILEGLQAGMETPQTDIGERLETGSVKELTEIFEVQENPVTAKHVRGDQESHLTH